MGHLPLNGHNPLRTLSARLKHQLSISKGYGYSVRQNMIPAGVKLLLANSAPFDREETHLPTWPPSLDWRELH